MTDPQNSSQLPKVSAHEHPEHSTPLLWIRLLRPSFFTASVVPVLVGSSLGYAVSGHFDTVLFLLATGSIVCLHAGANVTNDYFDHLSGNDRLNRNFNPFSGGSRFIQDGLVRPGAVLCTAMICFTAAVLLGLWILVITRSLFILLLGLAGLTGGYFYTASPVKLGYRGAGEIFIALLFGILPVYGAYFLQTGTIDLIPAAPAVLVAICIFLVILINEFPDRPADEAAGKRTIVVLLGPRMAIRVYEGAIAISYVVAVLAAVWAGPVVRYGCRFYLLTLPVAIAAICFLRTDALDTGGKLRPNKFTILLHLTAGLLLAAGFVAAKI